MRPTLGTPVRILSSPTRVVGVSAGLNPDELVVTQAAQGVAVYNVVSRARITTWSLPAEACSRAVQPRPHVSAHPPAASSLRCG